MMRLGFLALSLQLDDATTKRILEIMTCARSLLEQRLERVELAKFDRKGELSPTDYTRACTVVRSLIELQDPDKVVFAGRDWIKQHSPIQLADTQADCVRRLIAFIRQDLCTNAQCKIASAWLSNGFGFWAKIFPGLAVPVLEAVVAAYTTAGIQCSVCGPPGLICPPKGGAQLKSHIDGAPASELRACIDRFIASGGTSNEEFAAWNGAQCLTHVKGGRQGSGATCALTPMTPARAALLLDTIAASDGAKEKAFFADSHRGPKFYTPSRKVVETYLARLHRIRAGEGNSKVDQLIREDGLPVELGWTPMVPAEDGPFTLAFPRGYFHLKQANYDAGRISFSGGVQYGSDAQEPSVEVKSRKRKFDFIAAQSRMATDPAAIELVRAEEEPFSSGKAHDKPGKIAAQMMAPGCPFAPLAYTPAEVVRLRTLKRKRM